MMIRHNNSKKTKIGKDSNSLPPDLLIEILTRLPVKAVSRFFLVSKSWSTIISSHVFIRSFPSHSIQPQPPRLLYAVNSTYKQNGYYKWFFYSSPSTTLVEENTVFPSSISHTSCEIRSQPPSDVHYVNGLISFGYGEKQIITSPSTGKSIYLPRVRSREKIIRSFFGFDPVESQYKVLAVCKSEKVGDYPEVTSSEHKVFTLMGREGRVAQAWRMVKCNTSPHCPITNSVCINGVMYYVASTGKKRMSGWFLMRFDVRTEKLDLLSQLSWIPDGFYRLSLINYQGKVTFVVQTYPSITTFDLWVMEDTVEWSKIRLDIPWTVSCRWKSSLDIIGTTHTGQIVFLFKDSYARCLVLYYDHKTNRLINKWFSYDKFQPASVMLLSCDYVENVMSFFSF